MKIEAFDGGDAWIRKDDHQFFTDLFIASFGPLDPGAKFDEEGTGLGLEDHRRRQGGRHGPADDLQDGASVNRKDAAAGDRRRPPART